MDSPAAKLSKISLFLCSLFSMNAYSVDVTLLGMEDINPSGEHFSVSTGISGNGQTVYGQSSFGMGYGGFKFNDTTGSTSFGLTTMGMGEVIASSYTGDVLVGYSTNALGYKRAIKYTDAGGIVDLGTLGGNESRANSVSNDGQIIVGYSEKGTTVKAFKYTDQTGMIDLGDLGGDYAEALAISADGSTIIGKSAINQVTVRAFKYTDQGGMVDLGSFGGATGASLATSVSDDGKVIIGLSSDTNSMQRVFKYTDAKGMVDLGDLGGQIIFATAVSGDGSSTIGTAFTANMEQHGFKHTDATGMVDLGTLGGSFSTTTAISKTGLVTVGYSTTEAGVYSAFYHTDQNGMLDLGGLGGIQTLANGISDDGDIISGFSMTMMGEAHAVIWRLKLPEEGSNAGGGSYLVDVDNTNKAMAKTSSQAYSVLDLHSSRLGALAQQDCIANAGPGTVCIGAFTSVADSKHANQANVGLNMAYQINDNWRAGLAMDTLVGSSLPDNYKRNSSTTPGMGAFIQYQTQADGTGFNSRLSGSYAKEKLEITRELLAFTEAGKGDADLSGWRGELSFNYGIDVNSVLFTPHVDLVYSQVKRSAYQEDRDAEFKATYGEMGEKRTSVRLGQKIQAPLSAWATADLDVGVDLTLDRSRDAFTGRVDYIGAYAYDRGDERKYRPYASVGANIYPTKNSAVRLGSSWFKHTYGNDVFGLSLSYSYSF